MRHRLTSAILLLYPRRVRDRHGPEIAALIDDLVAHEGRSRTGLFIRLAVDGLAQRLVSTATAWTVVAVAVATSFGGLAVSDFAAANATRHVVPPTAHSIAPVRCPHRGPRKTLFLSESSREVRSFCTNVAPAWMHRPRTAPPSARGRGPRPRSIEPQRSRVLLSTVCGRADGGRYPAGCWGATSTGRSACAESWCETLPRRALANAPRPR